MWQVWRTRIRVSAPAQRTHWMNANAKVNIRAGSEQCYAKLAICTCAHDDDLHNGAALT